MTSPTLVNASLIKRLGSLIYDLFLIFAVGFAYSALIMAIAVAFGLQPEHVSIVSQGDLLLMQADDQFSPALGGPLFQAGLGLTLLLFYLGFWYYRSATLGMQTWRLKLVSDSGDRASLRQCFVRAILGFLSFAVFGIGYWWMLFDPEKIALHDRLSKTRVIQLEKSVKKSAAVPIS